MEKNLEFNLQEYISDWAQNLKKQPSLTDSDVEELKSHFFDIIDDLKLKGLDEEEACYIATKRLGGSLEWEEDYKQANNSLIQLKKSVMILSGIISYFFLYYLVRFSSKLFIYISIISGVDKYVAVNWIGRYLISFQFLLIVSTVSVYLLENRAVKLLEKINFKTKKIIYFLIVTFIIGVLDTCIYPIIKNLIGDIFLKSTLIQKYLYFNYSFPVLICICFLFLYIRFNKKNNS